MVTRSFLGGLKGPLLLVFARILLGFPGGCKGIASLFLGCSFLVARALQIGF